MVRFVGFCFIDHPQDDTKFIQICIYQLNKKEYVICLSEVEQPNIRSAKNGLGQMALGDLVAPFAQRHLDNVEDFEYVKKEIFEKSYKANWYWAK